MTRLRDSEGSPGNSLISADEAARTGSSFSTEPLSSSRLKRRAVKRANYRLASAEEFVRLVRERTLRTGKKE